MFIDHLLSIYTTPIILQYLIKSYSKFQANLQFYLIYIVSLVFEVKGFTKWITANYAEGYWNLVTNQWHQNSR